MPLRRGARGTALSAIAASMCARVVRRKVAMFLFLKLSDAPSFSPVEPGSAVDAELGIQADALNIASVPGNIHDSSPSNAPLLGDGQESPFRIVSRFTTIS